VCVFAFCVSLLSERKNNEVSTTLIVFYMDDDKREIHPKTFRSLVCASLPEVHRCRLVQLDSV
jgi:hypothetical protein